MKWLHFFIFAVFEGVALADIRCFYPEYTACSLVLVNQGKLTDPCQMSTQLLDCLDLSAKSCKVESNPLVIEVRKVWSDLCTAETDLNKMYLKNKECVFKTITTVTPECMADILKILKDIEDPRLISDIKEKVLKLTCEKFDDITQCMNSKVKGTCGDEAEKFYIQYSGPSNKLQKQLCIESGYGGVSAPSASILLCLLQVATVISLLKWFSD